MEHIILSISVYAFPILLAITVHEYFHGYIAYKLGDPTAKMMGRLTLNPFYHIDLFGTIILPLLLFIMKSPFVIAWAKPVPINPMNFKNPDRDTALSSVAGPLSNLFLCVISVLIYSELSKKGMAGSSEYFIRVLKASFFLNFALFAFNLLPVPPLDGSKVLYYFLPRTLKNIFSRIEPYGFFILLALLMTRIFDIYVGFLFRILLSILGGLFL
ncbi:MAG: site-2 protease family protein [Proteobacteria bacterium]|nr:site-2 protease family protein [Pseudomonadota bacterium]